MIQKNEHVYVKCHNSHNLVKHKCVAADNSDHTFQKNYLKIVSNIANSVCS